MRNTNKAIVPARCEQIALPDRLLGTCTTSARVQTLDQDDPYAIRRKHHGQRPRLTLSVNNLSAAVNDLSVQQGIVRGSLIHDARDAYDKLKGIASARPSLN